MADRSWIKELRKQNKRARIQREREEERRHIDNLTANAKKVASAFTSSGHQFAQSTESLRKAAGILVGHSSFRLRFTDEHLSYHTDDIVARIVTVIEGIPELLISTWRNESTFETVIEVKGRNADLALAIDRLHKIGIDV